MFFDPQNGAGVTAARAIIQNLYSLYGFNAALDYAESALLAALLARLVAILRRRSNPIRMQWRRLSHGPCHTPLQCDPPNLMHNRWGVG